MAGFHLTTGNDQQRLVTGMGEVFNQHPLANPLESERIVVQSMGMQRWISLKLASQLGIAANIEYLFPNKLLYSIFETVIPDFEQVDLFNRETMAWKVMELLPAELDKHIFGQLKSYLLDTGGINQMKLWQLAGKTAYLFDQYCMYRPEMIAEWDTAKGDSWQSALWWTLRQNGVKSHLPLLRTGFFERIRDPGFTGEALPERITVFGITSLPPLHIEVLAALSHYMDIHLFFLSPSPAYWGDIMSEKEIARRLQNNNKPDLTEETLHMEQGNPLLASFGKTGRNFFELVQGADFHTVQDIDTYSEPNEQTLLGKLQSDIYHLQNPGRPDYPVFHFSADDRSLQVHSCHSRMREIEVLHDQLQLIMRNNPDLKPGDILVMAPDINPYAPIIKAVFSPAEMGQSHLPYSIADRQFSRESNVIQWFLKLLALPASRFNLTEIMDLLESDAILARFGISRHDIPLLQNWLTTSNIRWGIDEDHRQAIGTPVFGQNSWQFGLDRLLLGLAMPDEAGLAFSDVLPFDRIEGQQGVLLGKFLTLFSKLRELVSSTTDGYKPSTAPGSGRKGGTRTLLEWTQYLSQLIETFFGADETWDNELQILKGVLNEMDQQARHAATNQEIEFDVIRSCLSDKLEQSGSGFGFLGAGITFCSMLPMRSIPFKVVCLLGLNDQAFPRKSRPLSFDLMAAQPMQGDRSPREDDRYLFLEAILSARESLYISYIGQHIKDNTPIPPAIVVSELLQYCDSLTVLKQGRLSDRIVTQHRLQGFNPCYFMQNPGPTGFSAENLNAARVLIKQETKPATPFIHRLPEPDEGWQSIQLDQLISFFDNPCRFLLKQRLGLNLDDETLILEDTEPFGMDSLDRYLLDQELVNAALSATPPEIVKGRIQAEGGLPPGPVGNLYFNQEQNVAQVFSNMVVPLISEGKPRHRSFNIELGAYRLRGEIDSIYPAGLLHFRLAKLKAKDRLTAWLQWLVLNLIEPGTAPPSSILIGLNAKNRLEQHHAGPVKEPEQYLQSLLDLYREGLVRPLPFFPATSQIYMEALGGKKPETALQKAVNKWQESAVFSEGNNPYFSLCFAHTTPINQEFMDISETVLGPVFKHYRAVQ